MKAPLRALFGWLIWLALVVAIGPIVRVVIDWFAVQPAEVISIALALASMAFMPVWFFGLRRLWRWADAPRQQQGEGA
ncbi:hypothetical protein LJR232_003101 [Aquipseudomonas alcaligenes]